MLGSALAYMSDDMLHVALPTIARDLSAGVTEMQWVVNGYFLTLLSLLLTAGSIGDVRGHRNTFLGGLVSFGGGALVCAMAPGLPVLVAGRAVQGLGAAFLLASGLALVNHSFDDHERGRAVGLYMGLTAVATAVGPALGGILVEALSWRAIFVAPLVFPAAAAVVTLLAVPETPAEAERRPDARSAAVAFATIAALSFALIQGPVVGFRPEVLGSILVASGGAGTFVSMQRRAADPMLPLELFRNPTFSGGNAVTLGAYTVSAGAFFLLLIQLQSTLGFSPAAAGAAIVPVYVLMLVGSPLAGRLADRV
ncbi:MAG: MFS transporter, partial [Myxococcota bacterium]